MMLSKQMLSEIREANFSYLILSQKLIRQDKVQALLHLGISEKAADLVASLSTAQIRNLASSNMLFCRFNFDDDIVWDLLTRHATSPRAKDVT